jgi:hypothetical protein
MSARSTALTPIFVSDENALSATGLSPRQFREFVREHGIPYVKYKRLTLVRADHLLDAHDRLSGGGEPRRRAPAWDEKAIVALAARRTARGSAK